MGDPVSARIFYQDLLFPNDINSHFMIIHMQRVGLRKVLILSKKGAGAKCDHHKIKVGTYALKSDCAKYMHLTQKSVATHPLFI